MLEEIKNKQICLVVINKQTYNEKSIEVIKLLSQNNSKTCYVALNKPYNSILATLKQNNVDETKFHFIDVLTATVDTPPKVSNCTFVESPNALTDLSLAFADAMNKGCDNCVFDAISTLIIHESQASVIKLSQNLMTRIRVIGKKAVFMCLKEDSETLVKDLSLFVDGIIEL